MLFEQIKIHSERSVLISFGDAINEDTHKRVQQCIARLSAVQIEGVEEIVGGYTSVCIYYEPLNVQKHVAHLPGDSVSSKFIQYISALVVEEVDNACNLARTIEIPVIYGGKYGPDLQYVADYNGLTPQQVIELHTSGDYLVYMLGFAPGFPFLGGLHPRITTPRKAAPRLQIEAGSVGIAGEQTGIYPLATPGGWQIIGRTFSELFLPDQNPPTLLRAGDRVKFVAIQEGSR